MERPKTLVVDASVAVKWFTREDGSDRARELLERHIDGEVLLAAPDLLVYEVVNALRYNPSLGKSQVSQAVEDLLDFQLNIVRTDYEWLEETVGIAFDEGLTFYDAAYLGLARWLNTRLCSADKRLLEGTGSSIVIALGSELTK